MKFTGVENPVVARVQMAHDLLVRAWYTTKKCYDLSQKRPPKAHFSPGDPMASVETKDPKFILGAIVVLAGALGGGSMMGYTIEPKEMTELRTEAALLRQQVDDLQKDVDICAAKHPEMKSEMQSVSTPTAEKSTTSK